MEDIILFSFRALKEGIKPKIKRSVLKTGSSHIVCIMCPRSYSNCGLAEGYTLPKN
jgi:hypothetical protein